VLQYFDAAAIGHGNVQQRHVKLALPQMVHSGARGSRLFGNFNIRDIREKVANSSAHDCVIVDH
jgi:hypothetical protein